jgi:hypothetical protein
MLPFAAVPDFAISARTAFVPGALLFAACAGGTFVLVSARPPLPERRRNLVVASLAATVALLFTVMVGREMTNVQRLQPALKADWDTLSANRDSAADVVLPSLGGDLPYTVQLPNQSANPSDFSNLTMAGYFGLNSVRREGEP